MQVIVALLLVLAFSFLFSRILTIGCLRNAVTQFLSVLLAVVVCMGGPLLLFAYSFSRGSDCLNCDFTLTQIFLSGEMEKYVLENLELAKQHYVFWVTSIFAIFAFAVFSVYQMIVQVTGISVRIRRVSSIAKGLLFPSLVASTLFYLIFLLVPTLNAFIADKSFSETLDVDIRAMIQVSFGIYLAIFSVGAAVQTFYRSSGVHYSASQFLERLTEELVSLNKTGGNLVVQFPYLLIGFVSVVPTIFEQYSKALRDCIQNDKVSCRIRADEIGRLEQVINGTPVRLMDMEKKDAFIKSEKTLREIACVEGNCNHGVFTPLEEQHHHFFVVGAKLFIIDMRFNDALDKGINDAMIAVEIREPRVAGRYIQLANDIFG